MASSKRFSHATSFFSRSVRLKVAFAASSSDAKSVVRPTRWIAIRITGKLVEKAVRVQVERPHRIIRDTVIICFHNHPPVDVEFSCDQLYADIQILSPLLLQDLTSRPGIRECRKVVGHFEPATVWTNSSWESSFGQKRAGALHIEGKYVVKLPIDADVEGFRL